MGPQKCLHQEINSHKLKTYFSTQIHVDFDQNEPPGVITTLFNLDTTPGTLNDLDYLSKGLSLCWPLLDAVKYNELIQRMAKGRN